MGPAVPRISLSSHQRGQRVGQRIEPWEGQRGGKGGGEGGCGS